MQESSGGILAYLADGEGFATNFDGSGISYLPPHFGVKRSSVKKEVSVFSVPNQALAICGKPREVFGFVA